MSNLRNNDEFKRVFPTNDQLEKNFFINESEQDILLLISRLNLYKKDNRWYYGKHDIDKRGFINELIGMYYCHYLNLDVVKYHMIEDQEKGFILLSENFRSKGNEYLTFEDILTDCFGADNDYSSQAPSFEHRDYKDIHSPKLEENLLKLTAVDISMRQNDRILHNLFLEKKKDEYNLAKIFDFEKSYLREPVSNYISPIFKVPLTNEGIYQLMNTFPGVYEYFKSINDFPMESMIDLINTIYPINITDSEKNDYIETDKQYKKIIRANL